MPPCYQDETQFRTDLTVVELCIKSKKNNTYKTSVGHVSLPSAGCSRVYSLGCCWAQWFELDPVQLEQLSYLIAEKQQESVQFFALSLTKKDTRKTKEAKEAKQQQLYWVLYRGGMMQQTVAPTKKSGTAHPPIIYQPGG